MMTRMESELFVVRSAIHQPKTSSEFRKVIDNRFIAWSIKIRG